ncbi:hypothetical protein HPB51_016818 [Rhipicephalus microplus]|uniref:Tick transposon n=1 Tax=Rhipicephalus microplus TaxID=6941 RepID=A0A9J6DI83_RHIMP|nr:hypothetical protein HPB51_016818 [Rhipicephalus microplus]
MMPFTRWRRKTREQFLVIQYCQNYDEWRKHHISTRRPTFDITTTSPLTVGAISLEQMVLTPQIQQFIREEVAHQFALAPFLLSNTHELTTSLRETIEKQVCEALPPTYQPPPVSALLTYTDVARRPAHAPLNVVDSAHQTNAFYATRVPADSHVPCSRRPSTPPNNPWCTPDDRPIFYYCRLSGNVERFCRRRVPHPGTIDETYGYTHKEQPQTLLFDATSNTPPPSHLAFKQHRSPSNH